MGDLLSDYLDRKERDWLFSIYIDFPFCQSQCIYCIYKSLNFYEYRDRIAEYESAVLRELEKYSEVFARHIPDTIYFGGGTPNLWSMESLRRIKELIPCYSRIKYKKTELHPANLKDEMIDFYADCLEMDVVSVGVQSFDRTSCIGQRRIWASPQRVEEIVSRFHEKGVRVNMDLVALFNGDEDRCWDIFEEDLSIACLQVKPDVITCLPNYRTKLDYPEQVRKLRGYLAQICAASDYVPRSKSMLSQDPEMVAAYGRNDHWIGTPDYWDFSSRNVRYNCSGPNDNRVIPQLTLSFGGAGKHKVYSYLPDKKVVVYSAYDFDRHEFVLSGK
ncbi:MAG: radical SAM protein [Lachnospiraceae bacterium]|nr:radical SAM protein [Lachnospiraceae bacterium]